MMESSTSSLDFLYIKVEKMLKIFPSNYSRPGRVWLVTSRLGTGKSLTFITVMLGVMLMWSYFEYAEDVCDGGCVTAGEGVEQVVGQARHDVDDETRLQIVAAQQLL
jgi:hypothetical protein